MALPASDSFVTDSSLSLSAYSASWTINLGAFQVDGLTDAVCPNDPGRSLAHWNADTFNNDQYAQTTQNFNAYLYLGPAVRVASGTTQTGYYYFADNTDGRYLGKLVAGANTYIGSTANDAVSGDVLRIEAEGTTITPKRNGSVDSSIGAVTDSAIASGYGGLAGLVNGSTTYATDWESGNLAAASPQTITLTGGIASGEAFPAANLRVHQWATAVADYDMGAIGVWYAPGNNPPMYQYIDELVPNDSDYLDSGLIIEAEEIYACSLGAISQPADLSQTHVSYRIRTNGAGGTTHLQVDLYCIGGPPVVSWTHSVLPTSWTTYRQTLTLTQAQEITDWSQLYLVFRATEG